MTLSRLSPLRRSFGVCAAAVRQETTLWKPAPLVKISPAAESLFNITIDVSDSPELASSYTKAGQYLQLRMQDPDSRPSFLAIASPPSVAWSNGVFEFLVKSVAGSTAELLCALQKGDVVELSAAMGKGFNIEEISPAENLSNGPYFCYGIRNQALVLIRELMSDSIMVLETLIGWHIRKGLKSGNLLELILCKCYPSRMIVGWGGKVMCRLHLLVRKDSSALSPLVRCCVVKNRWLRRSLQFLWPMEYLARRF